MKTKIRVLPVYEECDKSHGPIARPPSGHTTEAQLRHKARPTLSCFPYSPHISLESLQNTLFFALLNFGWGHLSNDMCKNFLQRGTGWETFCTNVIFLERSNCLCRMHRMFIIHLTFSKHCWQVWLSLPILRRWSHPSLWDIATLFWNWSPTDVSAIISGSALIRSPSSARSATIRSPGVFFSQRSA